MVFSRFSLWLRCKLKRASRYFSRSVIAFLQEVRGADAAVGGLRYYCRREHLFSSFRAQAAAGGIAALVSNEFP